MMKRWLIILLLLIPAGTVRAENRFPKPQFESGYAMPSATSPAPRSPALELVDVVVLAASLSVAAWLVIRRRSRRGVFLLTVFSLVYFGFWRKGCVCSVGGIQNVTVWLSDAHAVIPLEVAAFFILPLLFTLFFGRVFCAGVCPLGAIQEMTVLFPLRVPKGIAQVLQVIPVLYLGLAVLLAATGSAFIICRYDPFISIFRFSGETPILIAGIVLLLAGIVVARPYCRFLCPYGVLLNVLARLSKWHATITPDDCVQCRLCETACPFDAIRTPTTVVTEAREQGVRRLKGLLLLLPVLIVTGGWAGTRLEGTLARLNPTVRLAEVVQGKDAAHEGAMSVELEAFQGSGENPEELAKGADVVREQFHRWGGWLGGFLGGIFGLSLMGNSIRRSRNDYTIDRGECLSCARCFRSCPKEHERLGEVGAGHE